MNAKTLGRGVGALALVLAAGCAKSVADDPAFVRLRQKVDQLASDVEEMGRKLVAVSTLDSEVQAVSRDVQALKAAGSPGGSADAVAALERRLTALDAQIKTINETLARLEQARTEARPAPAAASSDATAAPVPAGGRITARRPAPRSSASPTPRPTPAGHYYTIAEGETVESVAQKFGISVEALRAANRLPAESRLIAGQQLYIPGAR